MSAQTPILSTIKTVILGDNIDLQQTKRYFTEILQATRYRDVFHIHYKEAQAWVFDYGVLVAWDMTDDKLKSLLETILGLYIEPKQKRIPEIYRYCVNSETPFKIHHDVIYLPRDEPMTHLALSHAFAQSCELELFEDKSKNVISQNRYLAIHLANTGKIPLSRRELAKLQGELFVTSSDITLHYNLLDVPEFFWEYPEYEEYYLALAKYLDLQQRINILNKKIETIGKLLNMLATEQNHRHSAFLEWVIIVLIMVEIVIYLLP